MTELCPKCGAHLDNLLEIDCNWCKGYVVGFTEGALIPATLKEEDYE